MFIKKTKSKNKVYYSIAETYRENGKVKHKNIGYLGSLDTLDKTQLENMAKKLLEIVNSPLILINQDNISEQERLKSGCIQVYKKLWDIFDFDTIFKKAFKESEHKFDALNAIFLMILDRLITPSSKLKSFENQNKYFELNPIAINHF